MRKSTEKRENLEQQEFDPNDPMTWPKVKLPETVAERFFIRRMGTYLLKSIIKEPVYDHSIHFLHLRNSEHAQH